jgi:hypothetical protein
MSEQAQKSATEAVKAAAAAHAEAQKQKSEEIRLYAKRLESMSRNQLRGELKRQMRHNPAQKDAGIELLASLVIFDTTRAPDNPRGKVGVYPV